MDKWHISWNAPIHTKRHDTIPVIFEWIKFCKYKDQKISVYNIGGTGDHEIDIAVFSKEMEEIYQCKRCRIGRNLYY